MGIIYKKGLRNTEVLYKLSERTIKALSLGWYSKQIQLTNSLTSQQPLPWCCRPHAVVL